MKNLGLGDLSVLAYGLNLAGYWPPCFNRENCCQRQAFFEVVPVLLKKLHRVLSSRAL